MTFPPARVPTFRAFGSSTIRSATVRPPSILMVSNPSWWWYPARRSANVTEPWNSHLLRCQAGPTGARIPVGPVPAHHAHPESVLLDAAEGGELTTTVDRPNLLKGLCARPELELGGRLTGRRSGLDHRGRLRRATDSRRNQNCDTKQEQMAAGTQHRQVLCQQKVRLRKLRPPWNFGSPIVYLRCCANTYRHCARVSAALEAHPRIEEYRAIPKLARFSVADGTH